MVLGRLLGFLTILGATPSSHYGMKSVINYAVLTSEWITNLMNISGWATGLRLPLLKARA